MRAAGSVALITAAVGSGLVAGLFFAFQTAVMPGLAKTDDRTFVTAMQGINVAILNPVFLAVFIAPLLALAFAAVAGPSRAWVIAAAALYLAMFVITRAGNIPLNDALNAVGATQDASALDSARRAFEGPWNRLHLVRTAAVVASFGCCLRAIAVA
ncbi:anthrone oxygenase family protein [Nocardioides antri]|uniref:DUF1772 domain-containing protein n=1 Tax=Nocardioides antri TaxID=2607659 RepID=A0A5B1M964_9ACTN|nr:anthrone oxygenase family protein [Nocardioides antri]KAA1428487.1 DUF1772 domain-containing protein [Nocardioides antri]